MGLLLRPRLAGWMTVPHRLGLAGVLTDLQQTLAELLKRRVLPHELSVLGNLHVLQLLQVNILLHQPLVDGRLTELQLLKLGIHFGMALLQMMQPDKLLEPFGVLRRISSLKLQELGVLHRVSVL